MILIFIATLLGFGDYTPGGAVSSYGDYKNLLDGLKSGVYGVQQHEQKEDNQNNGYLEVYKGYDDGYNNRYGYDDKKNDQWGYEDYVYDKNHYKDFDIREYDYIQKCDVNVKDCKDGRDCYDKASDRSDYDNCKNQYGEEGRYYDIDDRYSSNRYREDGYDDRYNLVGLGRRDREDQLIRPCALDDRQCIRKYLAKNSNCKPAYGPIPDPLYLKKSTVYVPVANLTVIRTRLRVTGLASIKISEFYVNKDTKNLVIALDFEKLNQTSSKDYFRYKRTAKESIVLADYASIEHRSGTFTAVIPMTPHLRLDLAEVHAFIDDPIPAIFIGPKAYDSKDPDVIASVAKLFSNLPTATQEYLIFISQLFTSIYIQENLCDFGLKLTSI